MSGVGRYRKKPVEIEAMKLEKPYVRVQEFCPELTLVKNGVNNQIAFAYVSTMEGRMRASLGDWIVKGVRGEFYPVKPEIFAQTYERVLDWDQE